MYHCVGAEKALGAFARRTGIPNVEVDHRYFGQRISPDRPACYVQRVRRITAQIEAVKFHQRLVVARNQKAESLRLGAMRQRHDSDSYPLNWLALRAPIVTVKSWGRSYCERTTVSMRRFSAASGPAGGAFWALQPAVSTTTSNPANIRSRNKIFPLRKEYSSTLRGNPPVRFSGRHGMPPHALRANRPGLAPEISCPSQATSIRWRKRRIAENRVGAPDVATAPKFASVKLYSHSCSSRPVP